MNNALIRGAAILLSVTACGHAGASSFLVLEPMEGEVGPSFQVLAPLEEEAADMDTAAASLTVLGEPDVTLESTAALPRDRGRANPRTLVIRGGVAGAPVTMSGSRQPAQAAARPADPAPATRPPAPPASPAPSAAPSGPLLAPE